jgi:hypothetical protein
MRRAWHQPEAVVQADVGASEPGDLLPALPLEHIHSVASCLRPPQLCVMLRRHPCSTLVDERMELCPHR